MPVDVRMASGDDLARISTIINESFDEFRPLYTNEAYTITTPTVEVLRELLARRTIWVAAIGQEDAGTVAAEERDGFFYVRGMAVLPRYRGRGIASRLLGTAEDCARTFGFSQVRLHTTRFLEQAIALYTRAGYSETSASCDLFGTPLVSMEKRLEILGYCIERGNSHARLVEELFCENSNSFYAQAAGRALCRGSLDDELLRCYAPPEGRLLILFADGIHAGCVALQKQDAVACEMRRLFVRQRFRGKGFGRALVSRILFEARSIGYRRMRLERPASITEEAAELYTRAGFHECAPYKLGPAEGMLHMECSLNALKT